MAKGSNKITIEVNGVNITGTKKELDKLLASQNKVSKSNEQLNKTNVSARRGLHGTANMSSNVTKNFSKMQQGMESGGSSGGLVRAYALLAANVFALSAAFGVLSRGAQVDTLISSMERLEVVSGKSIRSIARDLQEASGFGMDFAASLRSTSLALSAGFESKQIFELGEVARNAAVSLGRNLPDALDRIFRGVIKVEPELLDEIGLFVRVNEAAAKYASSLGIAVGDLTEFQKRQAFANEAIEQGQSKFQAFEDIQIDPFAQLATTFSDMTQNILSLVNKGLGPLIKMLSENKVLFGQLFLIVALQLTKMVIPAIGAFTLNIAANAAATREAAMESASLSKAKIKQLQLEGMEYDRLQEKTRAAEAAEARFSRKPQQLAVGGRKASRALEKQLQDTSIQGEKRLELVKLRIDDLTTKKGRKQRLANDLTKQELILLEREKKVLEAHLKIRNKIGATLFQDPADIKADKGSLADLVDLKNQKDILKADALASVTATAEFKGMSAGFGALGRQIEITDSKAKAAGISFTTFDKILMRLGGTAAILGVKLQATMMVLTPYITALMIAIPIVTVLSKMFGFFGEAQSKLKDANKETAETFKTLTKQMEHNQEQFRKFDQEQNFEGMTDSVLAMKESILSASSALQEQIDAFETYRDDTNFIVQRINEAVSDLFGKTAEEKIQKNIDQLLDTIRDSESGISSEMKKLEKAFKRAAFFEMLGDFAPIGRGLFGDTSEEELAILELAKKEVDAYKNVKSAIDGARDSARAFSDSLIVKTDVDKPLASFKQITTSLQDQIITEKERQVLLNQTVNDSAVLALLTQDQRNALHEMTELQVINGKEVRKITASSQDVLSVLDQIELSYARQQELLIKQKSELQEIAGLQSQLKSLTKFSETAIDMQVQLIQKRKDLELEGLKNDFKRKVTATGLTEERLRELSLMDSIVGREEELNLKSEQISMVQTAIASMKALQTEESKEQMRLATVELRAENDKVKVALEFLKVQENLNKMLMSRVKTQSELSAFATRGSTKLTVNDELNNISKQEELRNKNLEARIKAETSLATFKFRLADRELEVIQQRNNATIKELNLRQAALTKQQRLFNAGAPVLPVDNKELANIISTRNEIRIANAEMDVTRGLLQTATKQTVATIVGTYAKETEKASAEYVKTFEKYFSGSSVGFDIFNTGMMAGAGGGIDNLAKELREITGEDGEPLFSKEIIQTKLFEQTLLNFANNLKATFGEEGALPAALAVTGAALLDIATNYGATMDRAAKMDEGPMKTATELAAGFSAVSAGIAQVSSVYGAYMQQNIKEIDNLIAAEKKRDGKSKESLNKIAQLEKKKEQMKRKEFETTKKLRIAEAIMSTAAGVASALSNVITAPLAPVIAALGAVQIALISKMKYAGGSTETPAASNTALTIGNRSNRVDISREAGAGEASYLRGGQGVGSNANNFTGMSMGKRGYANGGEGIVVGERGPEVIAPSEPVDIIPNFALGGQGQNITFNINAVDGQSVQNMLMDQQGTIVGVIRDAANSYGEDFLPDVNIGYDMGGS
jgi:PAS domain-containing protein